MTYSKYVRAFGINLNDIKKMRRVEFAERFGKKFRYMSNSKFLKTIERIARAFEKGDLLINQYK